MAAIQIFDTEFNCKICNTKVTFNIASNNSYISKTPHEKFFGMQLTTYRVAHNDYSSKERHLNTVLVDHQGLFRGFVDAYSEPIPETDVKIDIKKELRLVPEDDGSVLTDNAFIDTLIVFDRKDLWVLGVIHPSVVKPVAIIKLLLNKITETEQIYTKIPEKISYDIADKEFHVWREGSKFVVAAFKEDHSSKELGLIIKEILNSFAKRKGTVTRRRMIILALDAALTTNLTEDDLPVINRLLTDNVLFSTIKIKYEDRIPRIVDRLTREFPLVSGVPEKLLRGETTVIELLETGYLEYFREIFDMIDFINRRNLLG